MNTTVTNIIVILSIILASSLKLIKCFLFSDAVKWKFIFGGNVEKAAAKSWHCQNIVDILTPFLTCSTQCQWILFFRASLNLHFSSIYIFWLVKCDGINHHIRWHVIIAMLDIINIHQTSPIALWVVKLLAPTYHPLRSINPISVPSLQRSEETSKILLKHCKGCHAIFIIWVSLTL